MGHHHSHEPNDYNTVSDMPWYRPWLLVAFLLLVLVSLTKGCKNSFSDQTYPTAEASSSAHHEHSEATHESSNNEATSSSEVVETHTAIDPKAGDHK